MEHTYYVAKHKKVYGTFKDDKDIVALLYAIYIKYNIGFIGSQDGVSLSNGSNEHIELDNRLRICVAQPRLCVKCEAENNPNIMHCKCCGIELDIRKSTSKIFDITT